MSADPLQFLTDWIRCSADDRDDIRRSLHGAIVDVGSGGGSRIDPCSEVEIADLTPTLSVAVDQRFDHPRQGPCRVRADVDGMPLPFKDGAFDAAVCMHVLEHVNQPADLMADVFRIVRPGGWVFVAVPNGWSFSDNLYKLWKLVFLVTKSEPIPHVQRFSKRSVQALLCAAGFDVRYSARIGESYEWLSNHRIARAGLGRLTRTLAKVHEETFSYGWLFVMRRP